MNTSYISILLFRKSRQLQEVLEEPHTVSCCCHGNVHCSHHHRFVFLIGELGAPRNTRLSKVVLSNCWHHRIKGNNVSEFGLIQGMAMQWHLIRVEHEFDRIQVWQIWWHVDNTCTTCLDELYHSIRVVNWCVVKHNDWSWRRRASLRPFCISSK